MTEERKRPLTEEEFEELLSGYLLNVIEPGESAQVEEYISIHPEVRPRLRDLEQMVTQMAYSVPVATPSFETKARILDRARTDAQSNVVELNRGADRDTARAEQRRTAPASPLTGRPQHRSSRAAASTTGPALGQPSQRREQAQQVQEETVFDRIGSWFAYAIGWKVFALGATAALTLLAFLFLNTQELANQTVARLDSLQGTVASLETQIEEEKSDNQILQSQVATLQGEVTTLQDETSTLQTSNGELITTISDLLAEAETLQQVNQALEAELEAQQTQFASLTNVNAAIAVVATEEGPDTASATLLLSEEQGTIVLAGLEPLPETQTYQLWLAGEEQPIVSAGLVPLDGGASTTAYAFAPPFPVSEIAVVGLSIEPAGGSTAESGPSGPVVLHTQ